MLLLLRDPPTTAPAVGRVRRVQKSKIDPTKNETVRLPVRSKWGQPGYTLVRNLHSRHVRRGSKPTGTRDMQLGPTDCPTWKQNIHSRHVKRGSKPKGTRDLQQGPTDCPTWKQEHILCQLTERVVSKFLQAYNNQFTPIFMYVYFSKMTTNLAINWRKKTIHKHKARLMHLFVRDCKFPTPSSFLLPLSPGFLMTGF